MTRSLLFATGTRADFGKIEALTTAARTAGFGVTFSVTGMHILARYGLTKIEVRRTQGARVHEFLNQRPGDPRDLILAKTVSGFSDYLTETRLDPQDISSPKLLAQDADWAAARRTGATGRA